MELTKIGDLNHFYGWKELQVLNIWVLALRYEGLIPAVIGAVRTYCEHSRPGSEQSMRSGVTFEPDKLVKS